MAEGRYWRLLVVFASFSVQLLLAFMMNCTGVLYQSWQNEFQSSNAQTGAIGSIIAATSCYGSAIGGVLNNKFGCRRTAVLGGALYSIGILGGSLTTSIYNMYITGALAGAGSGIVYTPAFVAVFEHFTNGSSLAVGITNTGNSIGMLILAPLMQLLLDTYGWRGTTLVISAISANILVAGAVFRPKIKKAVKVNGTPEDYAQYDKIEMTDIADQGATDIRTMESSDQTVKRCSCHPVELVTKLIALLRLDLLRKSYRLTALNVALAGYIIGNCSYMIYIVPFAITSGVSDYQAASLLSIIGITGVFGRVLPGLIKKLSTCVIFTLSMFISGCAILIVQLAGYGYTFFALSAAMLGLSVGCVSTSFHVLLVEFVGVDNFASALGIYSGLYAAPAAIAGPILSGTLYDAIGSFHVVFYVLAGVFFMGFLVMLSVPYLHKIEPGVFKKPAGEHDPEGSRL